MNPTKDAVDIGSVDFEPVSEWLSDLRTRVDGLEQASLRPPGTKEWVRLQGAVRQALSTERVNEVLGKFLDKVGVRNRGEGFAASQVRDLRSRILRHRHELTIEAYTHQLRPPPAIEF